MILGCKNYQIHNKPNSSGPESLQLSPLSRRKFIYLAAALPVMYRFPALAAASSGSASAVKYPQTISILQRACRAETIAAKHYICFTEKALQELETESCEAAIISCMYSWKSHQQHEEKARQILHSSGLFFGSVAVKIEGLRLDFHVCRICGSTIDEKPHAPCTICNRSLSNYDRMQRPTSL